ncbi:CcmD family protein [Luteitalea sp.]|jgi:CcmD family protein
MTFVTRMVRLRRPARARLSLIALLLVLWTAGSSAVRAQDAQAPPTSAAQDEYVPIDQLPESEKLPAAPYLIAAYSVAWGAILIYVWMLWRRLGQVEAELREARRSAGGR